MRTAIKVIAVYAACCWALLRGISWLLGVV